jgi:hypothetical protein
MIERDERYPPPGYMVCRVINSTEFVLLTPDHYPGRDGGIIYFPTFDEALKESWKLYDVSGKRQAVGVGE